jgi:UrcA family protein
MNRFLSAALAASALFGAVAVAHAEDARMMVKVSDLNVATEAGARTALGRIRFGAEDFCDADAGRQSLEHDAAVKRCVAEMTRKGVEGLHAPMVTALLQGDAPAKAPTQIAAR